MSNEAMIARTYDNAPQAHSNRRSFDACDPSIFNEVSVDNYRNLPRVTNSGLYELILHKVTLGTRFIKGEPRECLEVSAIATLQGKSDHSGRVSFKVDIPERGSVRGYDRFFYEFTYFTGSFQRSSDGRVLPFFDIEEVELVFPRYDGSTVEHLVKGMEGKTLLAGLARRNSASGTGFFMNVQEFFGSNGQSYQEAESNLPPKTIERVRSMLRPEGYELDFGTQRDNPSSANAQNVQQAINQRSPAAGPNTNPTPAAPAALQQRAPQPQMPPRPYAAPQGYPQSAPSGIAQNRGPVAASGNAYQGFPGYTAQGAANPQTNQPQRVAPMQGRDVSAAMAPNPMQMPPSAPVTTSQQPQRGAQGANHSNGHDIDPSF